MSDITTRLVQEFGTKIRSDVAFSGITTFKIGGPIEYFLEVNSAAELVRAVILARETGLPFILIGGGSNILAPDAGFSGLVIKDSCRNIRLAGARGNLKSTGSESLVYLEAESGVMMNQVVRMTIEQGLSGLEMHLGLPGTIGGAITQNSKWMHPPGSVGDTVYQAEILTPANEIKTVPRSYFRFDYGHSIIPETKDILISAVLVLKPHDREKLWEIANGSIGYRNLTQPYGQASAGCIFKNISQADAITHATPGAITSAGFLIDKAGLKGKVVGGAQVSDKHANFIINMGSASAADVIKLIQIIKTTVKRKFQVDLNEEIIRIG